MSFPRSIWCVPVLVELESELLNCRYREVRNHMRNFTVGSCLSLDFSSMGVYLGLILVLQSGSSVQADLSMRDVG